MSSTDIVPITEVNECQVGTANCHGNAFCTNTIGSFSCTCQNGYTGDGTVCNNVNECQTGLDNCHDNAFCSDNVGSFQCNCNPGYQGKDLTFCSDHLPQFTSFIIMQFSLSGFVHSPCHWCVPTQILSLVTDKKWRTDSWIRRENTALPCRDLNQGPSDQYSDALTTELQSHDRKLRADYRLSQSCQFFSWVNESILMPICLSTSTLNRTFSPIRFEPECSSSPFVLQLGFSSDPAVRSFFFAGESQSAWARMIPTRASLDRCMAPEGPLLTFYAVQEDRLYFSYLRDQFAYFSIPRCRHRCGVRWCEWVWWDSVVSSQHWLYQHNWKFSMSLLCGFLTQLNRAMCGPGWMHVSSAQLSQQCVVY